MLKKISKIFLIFISTIILVSSIAFLYVFIYKHQRIEVPHLVMIPKGSTYSAYESLKNDGIEINLLDYYLIKKEGYPQAGWIEFDVATMSRAKFYHHITHSKAALRDVTLIPGETLHLFFKQIAEVYDLDFEKLQSAYKNLTKFEDGVIFADTYKFPLGITEHEIVKHLIEDSMVKHKKLSKKYLKTFDETKWFTKYVSKASVIQKEAANISEMPIISAVIDNRLKKKMKLQMDGTLNYGKYSHIKVTKQRIREDNSHYNTYKISGLPKNPVSSVSVEAINAVFNPSKVNYLYFVKLRNGKHKFTETYSKHLKNIKISNNGK